MGSKTFNGIWFTVFADDHLPAHVNGYMGVIAVILDLLEDGGVGKSKRPRAVKPANAKQSDVRRILKVASEHAAELHILWEQMHGPRR